MIRRNFGWYWLGLAAVLAGCAGAAPSAGSERGRIADVIDRARILVPARPPRIVAETAEGIARARRALEHVDPNALARQSGARLVDANALPWLAGAAEGRAFLAARTPARVLVRGFPNERCPVAVSQAGPGTLGEVAEAALRACFARAAPGCGCQVVAVGSVLTVPRAELGYATGVAARIRAPALGLDGLLVAEEDATGTVILRDLGGVVGRIERGAGDRVTVSMAAAARPFAGRSIAVGYRRGRIAERIYATDDAGNRLSLLIGFGPGELAEFAGAWLAWPPDA